MGHLEAGIVEQARKMGMPLPDKIQNKPELLPGLQFIWTAFWELATCRSMGYGAEGPIWWTAIDAYANRWELDGDEFSRFFMLIKSMDTAFLKHRDDDRKKEAAKSNKGKGSFKHPGRPKPMGAK